MNMHVLSIGYGRQLFEKENGERERLILCAQEVASLHMVVFSLRSHRLDTEEVSPNFFLYATNSRNRFYMMMDAVRIGMRILRTRAARGVWCITTQDPLASGVVGWLLRLFTSVPLVIQEHGDIFSGTYWRDESRGNRVWYYIARMLVRRADRVRVVSERVWVHVHALGVPKEKIITLPVYTDVTRFIEAPGARAAEDASLCEVLTVARYVPQKNLPLLLRAFARVHEMHPRTRLTMVGAGPLSHALEKEARALGFLSGGSNALRMLAWSPDVPSLMKQTDIYALSSDYEGWARVLIEAMACGVPVVTTDVGCVGEVCKHEVHGLSVPVGDEDAFVEALATLVADASKRKQFGAGGPQDAKNLFTSATSYAKKWAAVYAVS